MDVKDAIVFFLFCCSIYVKCTKIEDLEKVVHKTYDQLSLIFNNDIVKQIGKFVSENKFTSSNLCHQDIRRWYSSLNQFWAIKMADSSAKMQSGIFVGNLNNLGQFDECLSIDESNATFHIKGKYCMAKFPVLQALNSITKNVNQIDSQSTAGSFGMNTLKYGICVPHSCEGFQINDIINNILNITEENENVPVYVLDKECSTNDRAEWTTISIIALTVFSVFATLISMSTLYDLYCLKFKKSRIELFVAFSIYSNTLKLLKVNKDLNSLPCLNGIRVLSMFWIILGHRFAVMTFGYPLSDYLVVVDWSKTLGSTMILAAPVSVDTFLLLSGLLLSYTFFNQREKQKLFTVPLFYLHRLLRIWPAMAALILFMVGLFPLMDNGPLWPTSGTSATVNCPKYWWSALLYLQNYVNPDENCLPHTWYLSVDMHLYILSPILLFPLVDDKKRGLYNLVLWIIVAQVTVVGLAFFHHWGASVSFLVSGKDQENFNRRFYVATHARATPWLLGFLSGYIIYKTKYLWQSESYKKSLKKTSVYIGIILGWILSITMMGLIVFGLKFIAKFGREADYSDAIYISFARTGWAIAVLWLIFANIFGFGGIIKKFLDWELWQILARLSYSMYLLHPTVQGLVSGITRSNKDFLPLNIVHTYFGDLMFTILISYIWVMAFESPFMKIEGILFKYKRKLSKETQNSKNIEP